jgi:SCP-2 sterol transfer family protein
MTIPPGTSPHALITELLPADHARLVPEGAGRARVFVHLGDARYTLDVDGRHFTSHVGERNEDTDRFDLALTVDPATLQRFLDDWSGPKRWLPKFVPRGGVAILTDPRLLRRLAMVTGRIELAIADFEGERVALTLAAGARAVRDDAREPDVVVELSMDAFERLLDATLAPDEAIADSHVTVRGKKLVAMQFALALVPFFPAR